jgi:shikimate dehydrogenase
MRHPTSFRAAGVIGWPIAQSRSPVLHTWWLKKYGIPGAYVPMAVQPGRLEAALRGLSALGFAGCNVTIPHKEEAARLVDRTDALGKRVGAVNLIVVQPDGSLSGSNTDGYGFIQSLRHDRPEWRGDAGPAVVLGAGGGARSVVLSLLDEGAPEIRLANRARDRAEHLAAEFGGPVRVVNWAERESALAGAALLVNTTSLGTAGEPALELRLDALPRGALVCDLVYNPLESPLLAAARQRGNLTESGLTMLLYQARPSFEAWFGILPEITPEQRAAVEATIR